MWVADSIEVLAHTWAQWTEGAAVCCVRGRRHRTGRVGRNGSSRPDGSTSPSGSAPGSSSDSGSSAGLASPLSAHSAPSGHCQGENDTTVGWLGSDAPQTLVY